MVWGSLSKLPSYLFKSLTGFSANNCDGENSGENMECDNDCRPDIVNGLCLVGKAIPVEVLCSILKWVDEDTLVFTCRLVCKQWKDIVDDFVWEEKISCTKVLLGPRPEAQVPWWLAYWMSKNYTGGLFNKNAIKNNCGQEKFNHWKIRMNAGDGWTVETEPQGAMDNLPTCVEIGDRKCCFVTSYEWCSKEQVIKLSKIGLSNKVMDEIQPDFEFSEWISSRFDCGGVYVLNVSFLDRKGRRIGEFVVRERRLEPGDAWERVSGALESPYPRGARYIWFHHKGKDTQFWKGHYGIKITGSTLTPVFPKAQYLASCVPTSTPDNLSFCQDSPETPP